ncbi:hypothetical protein CVD23_20740 [Bacillus sp. V33-4]|nr:hypothetical protein CVD23_20740 [Bacillus sp. V33-4]
MNHCDNLPIELYLCLIGIKDHRNVVICIISPGIEKAGIKCCGNNQDKGVILFYSTNYVKFFTNFSSFYHNQSVY